MRDNDEATPIELQGGLFGVAFVRRELVFSIHIVEEYRVSPLAEIETLLNGSPVDG